MPARQPRKGARRRRKLRVLETVPVIGSAGTIYAVKIMEGGKARCPCPGFRYRGECRHVLDPEVRDQVRTHGARRWPFAQAYAFATQLAGALLPYCTQVEIVGSLRRQAPDTKDVDLIFFPGAWSVEQVIALFRSFGNPYHTGERMGSITTPQGIAAQLWPVVRPEVWGAALLHFTGPRAYNISLRIRANRRGWKLSQHGLVEEATGRFIAGRSEQEVLAALGLPWIPPALRAQHAKAKQR